MLTRPRCLSPNGGAMPGAGKSVRGPAMAGNDRPAPAIRQTKTTRLEELSGNDKFGTRTLDPREGSAAVDCRRRRLHLLVCAHGPRGRAGRERSPVRADAFSQELDSGPLCRARALG